MATTGSPKSVHSAGAVIPAAQRALDVSYPIRDIAVPAAKLEAAGHRILKLNIGDPLAYPGFPVPEHMVEAHVRALRDQQSGYSGSYGLQPLREAIAADEARKHAMLDPEDVYVTTGVTEALLLLSAAAITPGDRILVPGPHYPPYLAYPRLFGAEVVEYATRHELGWQPDLDDLESKLDDRVRMVCVINPNNPTGAVYGRETLTRIAAMVAELPGAFLTSDEIYDEITFSDPPPSMASVHPDVPLIVLNGASKNYFAPGWRVGYAAFRDPRGRLAGIRDGFEKLLRSRLCASTPAQLGYLAGLIQPRGWRGEYIERMRRRRDLAVSLLREMPGVEIATPGGAFYAFPRLDLPAGMTDKQFALSLLDEEKVLTVFGSGFSEQFGSGHLRLVTLPPEEVLAEALGRMAAFLARQRGAGTD